MVDYPLVEVIWVDAGLESAQMPIEQAKELSLMVRKNTGYCLICGKEKVILCFGFIADKEHDKMVCDQTLVIPRSIVTQIKWLEQGEAK